MLYWNPLIMTPVNDILYETPPKTIHENVIFFFIAKLNRRERNRPEQNRIPLYFSHFRWKSMRIDLLNRRRITLDLVDDVFGNPNHSLLGNFCLFPVVLRFIFFLFSIIYRTSKMGQTIYCWCLDSCRIVRAASKNV